MGKINTTNFIFLKDVKPELYELAVKMENDLLKTPVSMLAYCTRFLEYILHDIAEENNYDVNTKVGFVDKVNQLIRFNYLDNNLHNNLPQLLIDAYNDRSYAIHNHHLEKSLKDDERTAYRLYETLFYIADAYYKKLTLNDEEHIYIDPKLIINSQDMSIDLKNDSKNHVHKKSKEVKHIVKKDIDSKKNSYAEPLLVIESENMPSDIKQQENIESRHKQNSQSIDEGAIKEFVKLLENGYSQQSALKHVPINQTILNNWYLDKKYEFIDGNKDSLFVKYNELLIENTIKSIIENKGLGNNGPKLEFWMHYFEEYIDELSHDLTKDQLKVFNLVFKRTTSKKDDLNIVKEPSDINIPVKFNISKKEIEKRKKLMLKYIDKDSFKVSLKKSKLPPIEVQKSKKEFFEGKRKNFYWELSQKLMRKYLISRNNGMSTNQFCKNMAIDKFEVDLWINCDLFKDFHIRYNKIRVKLFEKARKNNKTQNEILNDVLEMDSKQFKELIQLVNNDAEYIGVRNIIKEYYSHYLLEEFIEKFRKNPNIDVALKNSNLTKKDLENYLTSNKNLYDEFIEIKIDEIVNKLINQGKINDDQLYKLGMTNDEYSRFEKDIKKRVEDKQLIEITSALSNGMLLLTAGNVGCDIDTVFDWILKGSVSENKFSNFANRYWGTYINHINYLNFNRNINLKISINNIEIFGLKDHMDYWKKWGLINKNNIKLSINDIKNILRKWKNDF